MRLKYTLALLAVAGFSTARAAAPAPPQQNGSMPGWHPDLSAGLDEARKTGKPLLIVFR